MKLKNNKAITLIALVITIIVLLILAGVSINLLLGENGLITKARKGKEDFARAKMKEEISLMLIDYKAEQVIDGKTLEAYLTEKGIDFEGPDESTEGKIIIDKDGYVVTIDPITLEMDGPEKATKTAKIKFNPTVVAPGDALAATITLGEDVKVEDCRYIFIAKTEETVTEGQITGELENLTTSGNNTVATINLSTTNKVGPYQLYLLVKYKDNNETKIKKSKIIIGTAVESVTLNKESTSIAKGSTETLIATVLPNNATKKDLVWTSENTSIATVNENGVVTGAGTGTTKIRATATDGSNIYGECTVQIFNVPVESITLKEGTTTTTSRSVQRGSSFTLTAEVSPENATNKNVTWSSNHPNIASVNSSTGVVTGEAVGEATIIATSVENNNITASCTVTVTPILATSIALNETTKTLRKTETLGLTATVLPANADNKSVTWHSNDETVATVANGTVTAVGEGTTTITAQTNDGTNLSAGCSITVVVPKPITSFTSATGTVNSSSYRAEKSYDGNPRTAWGTSNTAKITYTFSSPREITSIRILAFSFEPVADNKYYTVKATLDSGSVVTLDERWVSFPRVPNGKTDRDPIDYYTITPDPSYRISSIEVSSNSPNGGIAEIEFIGY